MPPEKEPRSQSQPFARTRRSAIHRLLPRLGGLFQGAHAELSRPAARRIPFLDGLRALAVLLVIVYHVGEWISAHVAPNLFTRSPVIANGWLGVDLFFVLSGYFIGVQLWKELLRTGTVHVGLFMLRRGLRIWPLYFFTYATVAMLFPAKWAANHYGWTDLVFSTNYFGWSHEVVKGSWSLCTEEQFYLVAPAALLFFRRQSLRWWRGALLGTWALEIVVRVATYVHYAGHFFAKDPAAFLRIYSPLHTHSDGLLAGLLVANFTMEKRPLGEWLQHRRLLMLAGLILFLVCWRVQSESLNFAGLALFFATVVWWGLGEGAGLLEGHGFYVVSRLSFGMYLNHQYLLHWAIPPCMRWTRPIAGGAVLGSLLSFGLVTLTSVLIAYATFCMVEHPFLVLRTALLRTREPVPLVAH